eukprot:SAG31_NODE_13303_length_878_cov_1.459564_2_plen_88_part_00
MFDMHSDFEGYDDVAPQKMDPELRKEHTEREWAWIHYIAKEYGLTVQWLGSASLEELDKGECPQRPVLSCDFWAADSRLLLGWRSGC